ncbi:hypothetical protein ACFV6Z_01825 [Streptomyces sp. NPDC059818]|uniref:hypothetical protein n=1 Tax=Streptomyces sp. NPDC059818 TaxID=3346962 RepID=UPI00364F6D48
MLTAAVGAGEPRFLHESMKREIVVLAENGGRTLRVPVAPGATVQEEDLLAEVNINHM